MFDMEHKKRLALVDQKIHAPLSACRDQTSRPILVFLSGSTTLTVCGFIYMLMNKIDDRRSSRRCSLGLGVPPGEPAAIDLPEWGRKLRDQTSYPLKLQHQSGG